MPKTVIKNVTVVERELAAGPVDINAFQAPDCFRIKSTRYQFLRRLIDDAGNPRHFCLNLDDGSQVALGDRSDCYPLDSEHLVAAPA